MATKKKKDDQLDGDGTGTVIEMEAKKPKAKKEKEPKQEVILEGIIIRKAKIVDELFLYVEFDEELPGHTRKETKLNCTVPVHEDLKYQIDKLHKHLALLCDYVKAPKSSQEFAAANYPEFIVSGFSLLGPDAKEGVVITGQKEGKYGVVSIPTPRTKYAESSYPFLSELSLDLDACVYEVDQYLFHGKRAPEKQLEMDFGEQEAAAYVTNQ